MPDKLLFKELTPEIFCDWIHSIPELPVELKNSIKLEPYYSLIENEEERARFKCATDSYIKNTPKTAREALTRMDFADKVCTDGLLCHLSVNLRTVGNPGISPGTGLLCSR